MTIHSLTIAKSKYLICVNEHIRNRYIVQHVYRTACTRAGARNQEPGARGQGWGQNLSTSRTHEMSHWHDKESNPCVPGTSSSVPSIQYPLPARPPRQSTRKTQQAEGNRSEREVKVMCGVSKFTYPHNPWVGFVWLLMKFVAIASMRYVLKRHITDILSSTALRL